MRAVNDQLSRPYSTVQPTKFIAQYFCPSGFVAKISPYLSPNVLNFYGKQKFKTLFSLKFVLKRANDSTTISNWIILKLIHVTKTLYFLEPVRHTEQI